MSTTKYTQTAKNMRAVLFAWVENFSHQEKDGVAHPDFEQRFNKIASRDFPGVSDAERDAVREYLAGRFREG